MTGDLKQFTYSSQELLQLHGVKRSNAHGCETAQSEPAQQAKMLPVPVPRGWEEMPFSKKTSIPLCTPPIFPPKNFTCQKTASSLLNQFRQKIFPSWFHITISIPLTAIRASDWKSFNGIQSEGLRDSRALSTFYWGFFMLDLTA